MRGWRKHFTTRSSVWCSLAQSRNALPSSCPDRFGGWPCHSLVLTDFIPPGMGSGWPYKVTKNSACDIISYFTVFLNCIWMCKISWGILIAVLFVQITYCCISDLKGASLTTLLCFDYLFRVNDRNQRGLLHELTSGSGFKVAIMKSLVHLNWKISCDVVAFFSPQSRSGLHPHSIVWAQALWSLAQAVRPAWCTSTKTAARWAETALMAPSDAIGAYLF